MTRLPSESPKEQNSPPVLDLTTVLLEAGKARTTRLFAKGTSIFTEGEAADALFYIQQGQVKISMVSERGKEAVLWLAGSGDFVGERALVVGYHTHAITASALTDCNVLRLEVNEAWHLLREANGFSHIFLRFLLNKNNHLQESLADQLFNQSERRLARTLVSLAGLERGNIQQALVPNVTHQMLAEMVGTTRPRISFFMNRFKKSRFIEIRDRNLYVNYSLLEYVLGE